VNRAFSLIVTDTSPLITLALAGSLDTLLRPGLPLSIPDAVYVEATRIRAAAGAGEIVEWMNAHLDQVRIVPTEVGIDQQRRLEESRPTRALGEQAALEVLERFLAGNPTAEALLLFEDSDIAKRQAIIDERVSLVTTGDFLRELETAGLIQSADYVLDRAAERGRNVERQRQTGADAISRERLRQQLQQRQDRE
jgi:hypothetical protein